MPINKAQIDFIHAALDHLVVFSDDPSQFNKELDQLHIALTAPDPNPENEYLQLRCCLLEPEKYLYRLDDFNSNDSKLSRNELIEFILKDVVFKNIKSHLTKLHINAAKFDWNTEKITYFFLRDDKTFVSERANIDINNHPLILQPENCIYVASIQPTETNLHLTVKIVLDDPNQPITHSEDLSWEEDFDLPDSIENDNDLLFGYIRPQVNRIARSIAAAKAYEYFVANQIIKISDEDRDQLAFVPNPTAKVITNYFYFQAVKNNAINFHQIKAVDHNQAGLLIHPGIASLLHSKNITLEFALAMTKDCAITLSHPYYAELISQNKLQLSRLKELTADQRYILTSPPIINLMRSDFISLHHALRLPKAIIPVLQIELYLRMIAQKNISWRKLRRVSAQTYQLLTVPAVIKLLSNMSCDFIELVEKLPQTLLEHVGSFYAKLILDGKISLSLIYSLPDVLRSELASHPYIEHWLHIGIIDFKFIATCNYESTREIYPYVYASRLYECFTKNAFAPLDIIDTPDRITKEIFDLAGYHNNAAEWCHINGIINAILLILLEKLANDIFDKINNADTEQKNILSEFYTEFLRHKNKSPLNLLTELIQLSQKTLSALAYKNFCYHKNKKTTFTSFFDPGNEQSPYDDIKHLCDYFVSLTSLLDITESKLANHQHKSMRRLNASLC